VLARVGLDPAVQVVVDPAAPLEDLERIE